MSKKSEGRGSPRLPQVPPLTEKELRDAEGRIVAARRLARMAGLTEVTEFERLVAEVRRLRAAKRAACAECGYRFPLRNDGTVMFHRLHAGSQRVVCAGGRKPPRAEPARSVSDRPPEIVHATESPEDGT